MSTILKALERLEGERQGGHAPAQPSASEPRPVVARPGQAHRRRSARLVWRGAGLGLLVLLLVGWFTWRLAGGRSGAGPERSEPVASPRPVAAADAAAVAPPAAPTEPARLQTAVTPVPSVAGVAPGAPPAIVAAAPPAAAVAALSAAPAPGSAGAASSPESVPAIATALELIRDAAPPALAPAPPVPLPRVEEPPLPPVAAAPAPTRRSAPAPARVPRGGPALTSAQPALLPAVLRTVWHPTPERRLARLELAGRREPFEVKEGDAVGALIVARIEPSAVVFLDGQRELRRRVGATP